MAAALFISDLHLSGERPAINERFFAFLQEQASRAASLYVLGDLFEYWIGDEELDAEDGDPLGREVAAAFAALARKGIAVMLMHGNRDFLIGKRFCEASGARLLQDSNARDPEWTEAVLLHHDTSLAERPLDELTLHGTRRCGPAGLAGLDML